MLLYNNKFSTLVNLIKLHILCCDIVFSQSIIQALSFGLRNCLYENYKILFAFFSLFGSL